MAETIVLDNDPCYCCRESGCNDGCRCDGSNPNFFAVWGDAKAKALLEAAPDLLAALEQMQERNGCFDGCRGPADRNHVRACLDARAAIAKAKGETP